MNENKNFLSNDEINDIRNRVDIVEVISGYLPLNKRGKNFFGVCPFHDDHSPSMSVCPTRQIFTCFSCGASGNVFKFVKDYENITFLDAVKKLADRAGIQVNINNSNKRENLKYKDLYEIYELTNKLYQHNINTSLGSDARKYLLQRDITPEIIKEFEIGLALEKKDMVAKLLIKKQYDINTINKTGLVSKNDYGYYDMYYNRIMFPLCDLSGRVIGFSGRIYNQSDQSKYINSRETELFKKGELLYNYHRAKDKARLLNTIIVMEGFMDVIRAYTVGVTNVIATMGTAVTKNQATLIKRMAKNVILCFDGDSAGVKATISCIEELHKISVIPKIVRLEDNMDPDDYIKKYGKDSFQAKLDNPISVMDFKMGYLKENKDLSNQTDYSKYIHQVIEELSKIDDDILVELTLKKVSEESKLDIELLRNQLKTLNVVQTQKKEPQKKVIKTTKQRQNKYQIAERNLLYYMLLNPEIIKIYNKKVMYLPSQKYRSLAREISYFYEKNNYINMADLFTILEGTEDTLNTLNEIASLPLKDSYSDEEIDDYVNTINEYSLKNENKRIVEQIQKEVNPMKKAELLQKIVDLRKSNEMEMEK